MNDYQKMLIFRFFFFFFLRWGLTIFFFGIIEGCVLEHVAMVGPTVESLEEEGHGNQIDESHAERQEKKSMPNDNEE